MACIPICNKHPQCLFEVTVKLHSLEAVPYVNSTTFAKLRLLDVRHSTQYSPRADICNNIVTWNSEHRFQCKFRSNPETKILEPKFLKVSLRMETKGGKSFQKVGFVCINLSCFAAVGNMVSRRRYILEGYDEKRKRQDNSLLLVSFCMRQIFGDGNFKVPAENLGNCLIEPTNTTVAIHSAEALTGLHPDLLTTDFHQISISPHHQIPISLNQHQQLVNVITTSTTTTATTTTTTNPIDILHPINNVMGDRYGITFHDSNIPVNAASSTSHGAIFTDNNRSNSPFIFPANLSNLKDSNNNIDFSIHRNRRFLDNDAIVDISGGGGYNVNSHNQYPPPTSPSPPPAGQSEEQDKIHTRRFSSWRKQTPNPQQQQQIRTSTLRSVSSDMTQESDSDYKSPFCTINNSYNNQLSPLDSDNSYHTVVVDNEAFVSDKSIGSKYIQLDCFSSFESSSFPPLLPISSSSPSAMTTTTTTTTTNSPICDYTDKTASIVLNLSPSVIVPPSSPTIASSITSLMPNTKSSSSVDNCKSEEQLVICQKTEPQMNIAHSTALLNPISLVQQQDQQKQQNMYKQINHYRGGIGYFATDSVLFCQASRLRRNRPTLMNLTQNSLNARSTTTDCTIQQELADNRSHLCRDAMTQADLDRCSGGGGGGLQHSSEQSVLIQAHSPIRHQQQQHHDRMEQSQHQHQNQMFNKFHLIDFNQNNKSKPDCVSSGYQSHSRQSSLESHPTHQKSMSVTDVTESTKDISQ